MSKGRRRGEGLFSAVSAGFFFILVGVLFVTTPNLFDRIIAFFRNLDIVGVPNMVILLPAPVSPRNHVVVYSAVTQFSLVWGLYQIFVLALRFVARSSLDKKAETASNIVFWLGVSYLIPIFLNETTTRTTWFAFWAALLMLIGLTLIVRAIVIATRM